MHSEGTDHARGNMAAQCLMMAAGTFRTCGKLLHSQDPPLATYFREQAEVLEEHAKMRATTPSCCVRRASVTVKRLRSED